MARPFYVTTPIYYVNDVPHLGSAYTTIIADALRRYHALRGRDARMLTGTDEHGLKIERVAKDQGKSPEAFVADMSARFREAWPKLNIETSDFIRTHDPRHVELVQEIWRRLEANGYLYLGEYEDWYCVDCESFKTEKELVQPGNLCPLHLKAVEKLKEETYFFKLSQMQDKLLALYKEHPELIEPETRRNEVLSFVQSGLRDLSVSRTSFSWGVPVPGNPRHVMYVWFDALANYWTALASEGLAEKYWAPNGEVVHLVGKDILRFHAVHWPAILMAAGMALPRTVFAHGFLTVDGMKMSKTLRNTVNPLRLAAELAPYGGADVLRYQLLRAVAFGQDGDFDHAQLIERYNADLGKNLGNLLARTLGLCAKMTGGKTPHARAKETPLEHEFVKRVEAGFAAAAKAWDDLAPHRALEATWDVSSAANQYVDRAAPWTAAKQGDTARIETILGHLVAALDALSVMVAPAIPAKAAEMRMQLGLPLMVLKEDVDLWPTALAFRPAGEALSPGAPLFPTIDKDREKALLDVLAPKKDAEEAAPAKGDAAAAARARTAALEAADTVSLIAYDDFARVDLRVGLVKTCERVPRKDKLLRLTVDLGEAEPRTIIAGLALTFQPEQLVGKRVIVVANLQPRDFGKGLVSYGMLLASGPSEALHLATIDGDVPPGARLK